MENLLLFRGYFSKKQLINIIGEEIMPEIFYSFIEENRNEFRGFYNGEIQISNNIDTLKEDLKSTLFDNGYEIITITDDENIEGLYNIYGVDLYEV